MRSIAEACCGRTKDLCQCKVVLYVTISIPEPGGHEGEMVFLLFFHSILSAYFYLFGHMTDL